VHPRRQGSQVQEVVEVVQEEVHYLLLTTLGILDNPDFLVLEESKHCQKDEG
jgi:hypothetical protein